MAVGDARYKTIKGILAVHAENPPTDQAGAGADTPAFLRGPEELLG